MKVSNKMTCRSQIPCVRFIVNKVLFFRIISSVGRLSCLAFKYCVIENNSLPIC